MQPIKCLFKKLIRIAFIYRAKQNHKSDPANKHWLFNISSGVGDAVMAIPLLKAVHNYFPDISISVIANRPTLPLFQTLAFIRNIYCADDYRSTIKYLLFAKMLRKEKFSVYIGTIPSNTIRMVLIPFLSGIPHRIKHCSPHHGVNNYDFLFHHLEPVPGNRHRVDCNLDLIKALKVHESAGIEFQLLELPQNTRQSVERILSEEGYKQSLPLIAVHPGCHPKAYYKRWPHDNYVQLLNDFQKAYNIQILLVGGRDEKTEVQFIESGLLTKPLNMAGKLNLIETACALSFCKFLISNDSGIMHLAAALGIPVFAIFGPTNEKHIGPYGDIHTVIRNGLDINSVTVEQVSQILQKSEFGLKDISSKFSISQNTHTHQ